MTTCWIIYNGSLTSDKFIDQANLMAEAAEHYNVQATVLKNTDILMNLDDPISNKPDFVIFLDKDILLGNYLKQVGIPVFNDPEVIERCDNKAKQYLALSAAGVRLPKTIIAPKIYRYFSISHTDYYERVIKQLGFPLIIKEAHGSFGMKVYLIENEEQFYDKVNSLSGVDFVFQQYIASSYGRDVRVNIVGEQVIAAMYRHSDIDFRANITNGGTASKITLTTQQQDIAIQAAQAVGAQYAGVDLLFDENDEPIVCEVNAAAHIRNIYNVTGINVGHKLIEYILQVIDK